MVVVVVAAAVDFVVVVAGIGVVVAAVAAVAVNFSTTWLTLRSTVGFIYDVKMMVIEHTFETDAFKIIADGATTFDQAAHSSLFSVTPAISHKSFDCP